MDTRLFGEKYSDQYVKYTGQSNSDLNIQKDTSLSTVLDKLITEVSAIKNSSKPVANAVNNTDTTLNTNSIKSVSLLDLEASDVSINVITKPGSSNVLVTYATKNLPKENVLVSKVYVEGVNNGYKSMIVSSEELNGGFTLLPNNFPATLFAEFIVLTTQGEHIYKISVPLIPEGSDITDTFLVRKVGNNSPKTQTEVNNIFDNSILSLKNKVNKLTNVNVSGSINVPPGTDIVSAFNKLYAEVVSLKEEINKLTVAPTAENIAQGKVHPIVSDLSKLSSTVASVENKVSSTSNSVQQLSNQLSNFSAPSNGSSGGASSGAGGSSSGTGGSGGGSTGSSTEELEKVYGYCCSGTGCTYKLITEACSGAFYGTMEECQAACGKTSTIDPVSTGPCDVIILYNQENSCSDAGVEIAAQFTNLVIPNTYTITKSTNLTGSGSCKYVIRVKCGTKTSPDFKASVYSELSNIILQAKSWVFNNCTCTTGDPCSTIESELTITPTYSGDSVKFEAVKNNASFAIQYRRINGTYVNAPANLNVGDVGSAESYQVEFKTNSGKVCTFIKTYTKP